MDHGFELKRHHAKLGRMKWTPILLTLLATIIVTIWCAALSVVLRTPRGELAAWAQAIGSLVAVGAAIWSANYQAQTIIRLEADRREHEARAEILAACRLIATNGNRLRGNIFALREFAKEDKLSVGVMGYLATELETIAGLIQGVNYAVLPPKAVGAADSLRFIAASTAPILRSFAAVNTGVSERVKKIASADYEGVLQAIEEIEAELQRVELR